MSQENVETASDFGDTSAATKHSSISNKRSFLSKIFYSSQPKSHEERDKLLLDFVKHKDNELKEAIDQKHRLELQYVKNELENEKAKLKDAELKNSLESKCELLRTENLAAKEEIEKLRSALELSGIESAGKKEQLRSLEEKLAAKNDKLKKKGEEFEDLKEENKVLADELRRQKSDFERQRYELTHSFISDEAKLKLDDLHDKFKELEESLKAKDEQLNRHQEEKENLLAAKEELEKSLEDKEGFIRVSETTLYFDGKIGTTREFVMRNNTDDRIAFSCYRSYTLPDKPPITISPGPAILNAREEKTISVKCEEAFEFSMITIYSLKVPEGGGDTFQMAWYREDPAKIKMTTVFCKKSEVTV